MPTNDPRPSKGPRRDDAREKARLLREEQAKKEKRNRFVAIGALGAAVVALVVVVVVILNGGNGGGGADIASSDTDVTLSDVTGPSTAGANGGIPVGADSIAGEAAGADDVVVSVYFDFMCPYCGAFEAANASELDDLRAEGGVTIEYHVLAFLDRMSQGTEYSTRAGNAAAIVADQAPEKFVAFQSALFANQPEENTTGLSDEEIGQIALDAGVSQAVVDTFTASATDGNGRTYAAWLMANNNQMVTDIGKISTPTVLIDGEAYAGDLYTAGPLREAVEAAKG